MKSNGNSCGPGGTPGCQSGPADAATPLITTSAPPQADHWWYLACGGANGPRRNMQKPHLAPVLLRRDAALHSLK
jgi:hypothetical protein